MNEYSFRLLPTNLPEAPPCREQESNSIAAFITNKLDAQAGGYILEYF